MTSTGRVRLHSLTATIAGFAAFSGILGPTCNSRRRAWRFFFPHRRLRMDPIIARRHEGAVSTSHARRAKSWSGQDVFDARSASTISRPRRHGALSGLSGPIWLAVLLIGNTLPRICKPAGDSNQMLALAGQCCRNGCTIAQYLDAGRYIGVLLMFAGAIGSVLRWSYSRFRLDLGRPKAIEVRGIWLWATSSVILNIIAGVAAWLFVWRRESRRVARERPAGRPNLVMKRDEAHKRTRLQSCRRPRKWPKRQQGKSRHVVSVSHECARRSTASRLCADPGTRTPRPPGEDQCHYGCASQRGGTCRERCDGLLRYLRDRSRRFT